jgi:hypothetical protein
MLTQSVRNYLIENDLYDEESSGESLLSNLGVTPDSAFAEFYSHADEVTFMGSRDVEIDNIVWMIENSSYLENRASLLSALGLPLTFIPMDAFEGEGGFFYNTVNQGVYEITLGDKLAKVISGDLGPDWNDFNEFLIWYFDIQ